MRIEIVTIVTICLTVSCKKTDENIDSKPDSVYWQNQAFWKVNELHKMDYCFDLDDTAYKAPINTAIKWAAKKWSWYLPSNYADDQVFLKDERCSQTEKQEPLLRIELIRGNDQARAYASRGISDFPYMQINVNSEKDMILFRRDKQVDNQERLNKIVLHELGHILGFTHSMKDERPVGTDGYKGVNDQYSIMHYPFREDENGNKFGGDWEGHPGLSFWDIVYLHKIYPEQYFGWEKEWHFYPAAWIDDGNDEARSDCAEGSLAYGLRCKSHNCKHMRLLCRAVPKDYLKDNVASKLLVRAITGLKCRNKDCKKDNIEITQKFINTNKYQGYPEKTRANGEKYSEKNCRDTPMFTNMNDRRLADYGICQQNHYLSNVECLNDKCNEVKISCCPILR